MDKKLLYSPRILQFLVGKPKFYLIGCNDCADGSRGTTGCGIFAFASKEWV